MIDVRSSRCICFLASLLLFVSTQAVFADPNLWKRSDNNVWILAHDGVTPLLIRYTLDGAIISSSALPGAAFGVARTADGGGWIADFSAPFVQRLGPAGEVINTLNVPLTPYTVATDKNGNAWFTTGAGGDLIGSAPDGSPLARLNFGGTTIGVAVDPEQNIWFTDQENSYVYKITPNGTILAQVQFSGVRPTQIAIDRNGYAWVLVDRKTATVYRISPRADQVEPITISGLGVNSTGIAIDGKQRVWISQREGNLITILDGEGQLVGRVVEVPAPGGLAVDGEGFVWVSSESGGTVTTPNTWRGRDDGFIPFVYKIDPNTLEVVGNYPVPNNYALRTNGDFTGFVQANVISQDADFDGDGWPNAMEIDEGANPYDCNSRPRKWLEGSIVDENGLPIPTLFVNDSIGRFYIKDLVQYEPLSIFVSTPPGATGPAHYLLYAVQGYPQDAHVEINRIGAMAFPPPFMSNPTGIKVTTLANNFIPPRYSVLGFPLYTTTPAPSTVVQFPTGTGRKVSFTVQGIIENPSAPLGYSTTNAVVVNVR